MSILIKNAKIIHPQSPYHGKNMDILVKNGRIVEIAEEIRDDRAERIESDNLHVSAGWMDIGTASGEPGFEHRETLVSLSKTAAAGGYTALAVMPNTNPVVDSKSGIQFIINSTRSHLVDYYPIAAISKGCAGEEITEMIDMHQHGAVAFSDGKKTIRTSGLMLRALQYSKVMDAVIINQACDESIANGNDVHEGEVSTGLGLKASPVLSEVIAIERDIKLARYAEARLLLHNISSAEAAEHIATLSDKSVFASVPYLNLCKTDEAIAQFDVNFKVNPPLRAQEDRHALIKAVGKGVVQLISSNHTPLEEELKKKEFVYAEAGAIGLQTCFSGLCQYADGLSIKKMIKCLAYNPRKILGLDIPPIEAGAEADLSLFDPDSSWTLDERTNTSLSKNSPFWKQELKGRVIGVVKGRLSHFNNY